MRIGVLLLLAILSNELEAQQAKHAYQYLDEYGLEVKDPGLARFYRTVEQDSTEYIVTDYYVSNDSVEMVAHCKAIKPKLELHGQCTWYYPNGIKKEEGNYVENRKVGLFKTYYNTGNPNAIVRYEDEKVKYLQVWTPGGEELLDQGTGFVDAKYNLDDGKYASYKEIKDSVLVGSFFIRKERQDTIYLVTEHTAEYAGGMPGFYRELGKSLKGKYPKMARRLGVEGRVFIEFVIDKEGRMVDKRVLKGIGAGCDEVAMETFSNMNRWNPAVHHNRKVRQLLVLPVVFRLN